MYNSAQIISKKTGEGFRSVQARIQRENRKRFGPSKSVKMNQKRAWKKAERLLKELTEFMSKNCEVEPDIDEGIKDNIRSHIDFLSLYENEL